MMTSAGGLGGTDTRNADERWADWVAKGAAEDRVGQRRAVSLAAAVACGLAVWLAIALARG